MRCKNKPGLRRHFLRRALRAALLLIPLACSLFGIPLDVSMQVVAVGFIISVVQDSAETALNSSTDVVYTYAVDQLGKERGVARQAAGA